MKKMKKKGRGKGGGSLNADLMSGPSHAGSIMSRGSTIGNVKVEPSGFAYNKKSPKKG